MFPRRQTPNSGGARGDLLRSRKVKAAGNRWVQESPPAGRAVSARSARSAALSGGTKSQGLPRDWSRTRLVLVGVVFIMIWSGLWARAWFLQVHENEKLSALAERQHRASEVVVGQRGEILDRNGKILARSFEVSSVYAVPKEIADVEATATILSKVLALPRNKLAGQMKSDKKFVWLARKVSDATAEEVKGLKLQGVYLESEYERAYPYKQLAGQLLGFVGVDDEGLEGLEKSFDDVLSGRRGRLTMQRDAAGRRLYMEGLTEEDSLMGRNIRLTLDAQIQYFAEDALSKAVVQFGGKWGGCLVIDVPTGEILAWAEYPFFNPNDYREYEPAMWRRRLAMDALEPGSTVKPLLVAGALSANAVKPDATFYCEKGKWKYNKITVRDTHSYDRLPLNKILSYSSNIGAAKIGLQLGAKNYYNYLSGLGFGQKTGLPLPGESLGILRLPKQWSETDLINASFGQSISVTGIQMAQAYLALAAGGERRPLKLIMDESGRPEGEAPAPAPQVFERKSAELVLSMLREVVEEDGTGTRARISIPGIVVGGKTGTAQKASGGSYGKARLASFVGIAPLQNPRYLVLIMVDEPRNNVYGGVVAAPVFRQVVTHTLAYRGELPEEKLDMPGNEQNVLNVALALLEKDKARASNAGEDLEAGAEAAAPQAAPEKSADAGKDTVKSKEKGKEKGKSAAKEKSSASGAAKSNDGAGKTAAVEKDAAAKPGVVPNVVGKSVRRAMEAFMRQGVMPVVKGQGEVVLRQEPKAGTPLTADSKLEYVLWLSE